MTTRFRFTGALAALVAVAATAIAAHATIATAGTSASVPAVRPVVLPRDHGAHPGFGEEWWYTTGTVTTGGDHDYFWFATIWSGMGAMVAKVNVVDLRADRIVLSHEYVAATPPAAGSTRLSVGAFDLDRRAGGALSPWTVQAPAGAGADLSLTLTPRQPYVLSGPSAYYSDPRLAARGTLELGGHSARISGQGWFDHQWGNFATDVGALKWNWFACQFTNGSDLMLYQFLNGADRPTGRQTGTFVARGGRVSHPVRFTITPLSPSIHPADAHATYPLRWRLQVPADHIDITVRARARHQFIVNQFVPNFWEAASAITSGTPGTCTVESSREVAAGS